MDRAHGLAESLTRLHDASEAGLTVLDGQDALKDVGYVGDVVGVPWQIAVWGDVEPHDSQLWGSSGVVRVRHVVP